MSEIPFASFVLERRLAVGGMSEVFLARRRDDPKNGKKVVVKRILPDLVEDDAVRETFDLEAKLHRGVHHPCVVDFHEVGTYAGEPYIVMEHVDGVDLSRIMKRAKSEDRPLDTAICVHAARRVCEALVAIHSMKDERGNPLGVVHRDVTPSNILVSKMGEVKLGDFGIAHVTRSVANRSSLALRGKYAYLAPEQVSGEAFDHRADLFSLTVVLSEALIGAPLFAGAGQLAVLLAIRDARIDTLRAAKGTLPPKLYDVLVRALSKDPAHRYSSAAELDDALSPFEPSRTLARSELAGWVAYTEDGASAARRAQSERKATSSAGHASVGSRRDVVAVPPSVGIVAVPPLVGIVAVPPLVGTVAVPPLVGTTEEKICVLRVSGQPVRSVRLAKLIELLATGQVTGSDEVDLGDGLSRIEDVPMLSRYLPRTTQTTRRLEGPGVPDFLGALPESSVGEALAWIVRQLESGVLFAEPTGHDHARSELYFSKGKLILAVSSEPAMLLGERLVSKGLIDRSELDLAVLVMHRYNGQLGDTIIGLGLADPMEVFQALREQGRERVTSLFRWKQGKLSFYRGIEPSRVDFRLDLDVPGLMLAGLSAVDSSDERRAAWVARQGEKIALMSPKPSWTKHVTWPAILLSILRQLSGGRTIADVVAALGTDGPKGGNGFTEAQIATAFEACELLGIVTPR